jgi:hypothetical protein
MFGVYIIWIKYTMNIKYTSIYMLIALIQIQRTIEINETEP